MDMELTSRELATVILAAVFLIVAVLVNNDRAGLGKLGATAMKLLFHPKVWPVFLGFFLYSSTVIWFAHVWHLWAFDLLKDTIIIVLFTGIPLVMSVFDDRSGGSLIVRLIKQVIGIGALLLAYINLASFPLWGELIFQSAVAVLLLLVTFGEAGPDATHSGVARFAQITLGLVILGVFVYTTYVITEFSTLNWDEEGRAFLLSIWLPIMFLPAVYPLAYAGACEVALTRIALQNNREKPPALVRLAVIVGLRFSLRYANGLTDRWPATVAETWTYRSAAQVMSEFREAARAGARGRKNYAEQVKRMTGVSGRDADGLWLDRREFEGTKEVLRNLGFTQMSYAGDHKNRYRPDMEPLMCGWGWDKLPAAPGIQTSTSKDRRTWAAWRRTAGGYFFGVGGRTDNIYQLWLYDGVDAPAGFPQAGASGWETDTESLSLEWQKDDNPPPEVLAPRGVR
ncbi:hypothetical protein [Leifsonia shinshuensis]|uniref:Uncharacterized protein n=1 Tax=Leifsonia shinshuensis TaxID=150026 RepID=A0A7G6YBK7_9MICO|nr:hypothetical protein [Leifsonia shinshuensis]QNE35872.1 hypothetical protein F1C12_12540 [Leifsonia shinshuensis]